jgi:sugar transferase (PEP-CTERM system associated)
MIRLLNAYFPKRILFLGISETCLVVLAFIVAAIARLGATDASLMLIYEQGLLKILSLSGAFIICMYYFDLYDSSILSNKREVLTRLVQVVGTVSIVLAFLYYIYPPLELGRGIFIIGLAIVAVTLMLWRRLFFAINGRPQFAERAVIFGDAHVGQLLLDEVRTRPELGLRIVARISEDVEQAIESGNVSDPLRADLTRFVESQRVNRIILAMRERRGKLPVQQLLRLKNRGVNVQDGASLYEAVTGKVLYESLVIGGLIFSTGLRTSRVTLAVKRASSFLFSALALLITFPLLLIIAPAIKLTSEGPVFYKQKRVGRDNKIFDCYKLRTMRADAEAQTGAAFAVDNDPRVTSVGRFLRTLRLDEIPQLWNVIKGDMNLIGPRPERPEFVRRFDQEIPCYNLRHIILPGITGWAQVRYGYGNSIEDTKEKLGYDLFYIKNLSQGLDLLILFHTIKIVLLGRGAK